jgi:hypothetical protein
MSSFFSTGASIRLLNSLLGSNKNTAAKYISQSFGRKKGLENIPTAARTMNPIADTQTLRKPTVYVSSRALAPAPIIEGSTPGTAPRAVVFWPNKFFTKSGIEVAGRPALAAALPTFAPMFLVPAMKTALSERCQQTV